MKKYKINEDVIFTIKKGVFALWNLTNGEQYQIYDHKYLDRIYELTTFSEPRAAVDNIDEDLIDAGILELATTKTDFEKPQQWGWDEIAKIFHLGTKHNFPCDLSKDSENPEAAYVDFCESIAANMPSIHIERDGAITNLPNPSLLQLEASLLNTLKNRKTSRHFKNIETDVHIVSDLLFATFGKFHGDTHEDALARRGIKTIGYRRSSPSAGCLQATEAYLIALNVKGLQKGIYHYRPQDHSLSLVKHDIVDLSKTLCHQTFATEASFLIVMTSRFDKLWWKYPHSRAYRSALLDVGHLSQTFNLSATAYKLDTWLSGYFIDDMLNKLLEVDGINEHSIFVMASGAGYSDPISPNMQKLI
ncbi:MULTISPECIES: SagB/ThcOx family dehydrogenase [Pseudomonas]|uniref:SagB/ThcOx family dehydrogenase n=1 Tax=Pseudomonas TaxID=286 RepID=UPI000CF5639C|nr:MULTISPECIES: SagB/ThcOx family dehydrogenase [Pseudomonas]QNV66174.1 SagB/ThcOx family dehydrogenase [Pseudomonas sp. CFA]MCX2814352.1 SagB/ThcOx family dehydrogenase [Pseudomonas sp. DCB_E]MCX9143408.1 SagB/ThcOx family dehydrogenase [Pseudomonas sp. DCB_Q]MDD2006681.1 SagB/ThcOx family dehydrogenase [Pseudomonas putida]MDH0707198.1 SagB/ThcOx family dehydrogenase [Pseudomonas sp. GD03862]